MIEVSRPQKRALAVATALAVVGGIYFLQGFFLLIAFAATAAFMFSPLYKWLLKRGLKPALAAALTLLASLLVIVIPVMLIAIITVYEAATLANNIENLNFNFDVSHLAQQAVDACNNLLRSLGVPYHLSLGSVTNYLSSAVKSLGTSMVSGLSSSISSFFGFFVDVIIYLYVFLSLLVKQDKVLSTIHQLSPLGREVGDLYVKRTAAMTKAMVRGQFIIALAQGFTDASLLYLAGFHSAFFFFFLILTALSIIPLGGGIVVIPVGIFMLFTGHIWQGVLLIAGHILIVTNIDNVLRPRLVPKEAQLDPALTLLSVFAGLKFFGFLGIIIGPVLMILITTTIQVFLEVFRNVDSIDQASQAKPKRLIHRLAFWSRLNK